MKKRMHLIGNAHLDPIWQWEWEEGAGAALSTFRAAASFCREYDGFIFCHNEALLYRWIEEYEPALFAEIGELVKLGKWHIMGGWHLQPDCNMPSGEGFVRNIQEGRRYFWEKFGVTPTTAINFDPFGHTRGLVQIMARSGFDSYLFCRPGNGDCPLPSNTFRWVGYDGSELLGARSGSYNSALGKATQKINKRIASMQEENTSVSYCLWGVGNHGGGPSRKDLGDIAEQLAAWEADGVTVLHSTPEQFFSELRTSGTELPRYEKDLNLWSPGCYTSQVRIKQKYRQLENQLFLCEKMCSALASDSDFVYPAREIGEALYDMLNVQFHDVLPGSSVQTAEEDALRMLDHGLEILSRVRARAFFRLSADQPAAKEGDIPVIAYNPHPYPVEGDFACEFVLADQNWKGTFTVPTVYQGEEKLPTQLEKERSNIPIDWRKRVVFHATLPPMQISRFDCRLHEIEEKPPISMPEHAEHYVFDNGSMCVKINRNTGLIDACTVAGVEYLSENALSIDVYRDDEDPWGMRVNGWRERIGAFALLSDEAGSAFSALDDTVPSVRVVEDGEVRTVIEAVFGYGSSNAVVRYLLSKLQNSVELQIRIVNSEKKKLFKLAIPCAAKQVKAFAEVAYGEEPYKTDGIENIHHKYIRVKDAETGGRTIRVYNRGIYASSIEDNRLTVTLMRSPAYTAHPVLDRKILPTDRYSAYIDQGERLFDLKLCFGEAETSDGIAAQLYNEEPVVLSFFPSGKGQANMACPAVTLEGDKIVMTTMKRSEYDNDRYILRLFNPEGVPNTCSIVSKVFDVARTVSFNPFEIKSFSLSHHALEECEMIERGNL
ncbi:MAG: alpha-mannosidase [Clostridia bacterium]|nr:alpha-mannosidase [Clostridia bacterium]